MPRAFASQLPALQLKTHFVLHEQQLFIGLLHVADAVNVGVFSSTFAPEMHNRGREG